MARKPSAPKRAKSSTSHEAWQERFAKDPWAFWAASLAGEKPPMHDGDVHTGFYRERQKNGTFKPVAVWYVDGELMCRIGDRMIPAEDETSSETGKTHLGAKSRWSYFGYHPIPHETYVAVAERGEPWPDGDDAVQTDAVEGADRVAEGAKGAPDDEEAVEDENLKKKILESLERDAENRADARALDAKINQIMASVEGYKEITSNEQMEKAQSVRSRLNELAGEAKKAHASWKAPFWAKAKQIDNRWLALDRVASGGAFQIRKAMEAFQDAQRAAERKRLAEQQQAAQQLPVGNEPSVDSAPPAQPHQPSMPQPVKGSYGRAASTQFKKKVTDITDVNALFAFIRGPEDPPGSGKYPKLHPEMQAFMLQLAQRALNANLEPPGVAIEEKAQVS